MEELHRDDKTWGALVHLGGIVGQAIMSPVGNIIGALVLWLIKRNESRFIDQEGKEALNFQITLSLIAAAIFVINGISWGFWSFGRLFRGDDVFLKHDWDFRFFSTIGLMKVVWILNLVFSIIAAVSAGKGTPYRYPISFRIVK